MIPHKFRVALIILCAVSFAHASPLTVSSLGIRVQKTPRQFVFTNKEAGTYYSEARAKNAGGWFGWFVNAEKILHDYTLVANGRALERSRASVTVYPHEVVRTYPDGTTERFRAADSIDVLMIDVTRPSHARKGALSITAELPDQFRSEHTDTSRIQAWKKTAVSSVEGVPSAVLCASYQTREGVVFIFSAASSIGRAMAQADSAFLHRGALDHARQKRMNRVLERAAVTFDDAGLTKAFAWAVVQMDALIMRQKVNGIPTTGIFAGLPWFNNYWGRDSFISLPGATYVTGNFSDAKDVLRSYARFQEKDSTSTNYGRIPNLATPTSVQYNTADGTPWFTKGVAEYVRASGDTAFYREMYPVLRRAIEGTLKYHTDSLMFLTHADAETWMDAVGPEGPWSPRGTRANDIQALWHDQLLSSAEIARVLGDTVSASRWHEDARRLRANFQRLFLDTAHGLIYDHLRADGTPARELRPNQLFCLDLIDSDSLRCAMTAHVLSQLVYPYGTGTLSQLDSNFTPYHHYEPYYVQDAAYHNGIVWTWLNGAVVRAAARCNRQDVIYPVIENMAHQILDRGCVGALSELLDAHARPGEREPRLSGTYSQAWSLAEFIRSMYEDVLGARVDAVTRTITLTPHLPSALHSVRFPLSTPEGVMHIRMTRIGTRLEIAPESALPSGYRLKIDTSRVTAPASGRALTLAHPTLVGYLKALKGPSYPLLSPIDALAENPSARVLVERTDSTGDDRGLSGTYTYPSTVQLKQGSLDLVEARVRYDKRFAYFTLHFAALSDPGWHPEYGFQLTLAAIAIHRSAGDTALHAGANSKMTLDPSHAYSRMIVVGGGYRVSDETGAVLCEYRPRAEDAKHPMGSVATRTVHFSVPLQYLGAPSKDWRFTILVGAQDDHGGAGVGEFRAVDDKGGEWTGGGKKDPSAPNVYDVLVLE